MSYLRRGIVGLCVLLVMAALSAAPAWAVNPCVVASNADSGASSLRAVITEADSTPGACPTITFQSGLQTITLTSGALPAITTGMTINGTGSPLITTNGTGGIFSVTGGDVTFDNLTIDGDSTTPHPQAVDGGAITVDENSSTATVTIENSTFESDTEASGYNGGAIADLGAGTVAISSSTFEDDSAASGSGGAVYFDTNSPSGASPTVSSSLFESDSAIDGGAIYNAASSGENGVQVSGSTFEDDTATADGGAVDNAGGTSTFTDTSVYDSVLIGNTAHVSGGAIANGDGGKRATVAVGNSEFSGNDAQSGDGGAIYDAASTPAADSYIWQSTFAGDKLDSGTGANGYAIYATSGQSLDVAANLFVEDCAGTFSSTGFTSTGYNVAMPANSGSSSGGAACAGGASGDQVTTAAGDVAQSSQDAQLLTPVAPNPALELIPGNASVELGGSPAAICPVTDLLGNQGPDVSGMCNAGALQNPPGFEPGSGGSGSGSGGSGSGSGAGSGSGSGGTGTTPTPISSPAPTKKTKTTTVKFDNQQITLVSPNVCTAPGKSLSATLSSKKIKRSKKPKLGFKLATFTAGGRDKHTAKRLTAKISIKLRGLKAHSTDKLKVVVAYRMPRKHKKPKTVSKTITVKFKIC